MPGMEKVALLYDDDAYVEVAQRSLEAAAGGALGLMGRQVAGREFLDAYLTYGQWSELVALVHNRASAETLTRYWQTHPATRSEKRELRIIESTQFQQQFFPSPPASLLYLPGPPHPAYGWARQHKGPGAFALSGVTHTLCAADTISRLCDLVTAPFEPFDSLICTSQAVAAMVRTLTTTYADYLRDRHGGHPGLAIRLETIPLGVNPERYRPPSAEQRTAQRRALNIRDDAVAVLFVGRLSFHAKAQPFPMLHGLAEAARRTGQGVHLILSGWAANPFILKAFLDGLSAFAPQVPVSVVDGADPQLRYAVWQAADLFTSLSDNVQETFGLVILEAMASGLPVIASDWNGYRDLVVDGETGYLVPTYLVVDGTSDATTRLLLGEVNYDEFLAECSQGAVVDVPQTIEAFCRLLGDRDLRTRMGAAGRQRILSRFTWQHVIGAYEELWASQEKERLACVQKQGQSSRRSRGPACYPAVGRTFGGYPTRLLREDDRVQTVPGANSRLETLRGLPLTNYAGEVRCQETSVLLGILSEAAAPRPLVDLDGFFVREGIDHSAGRATVAWMLKYGLLRTC
jgi:glycosyltransferase involved in cell wall biosynthesis